MKEEQKKEIKNTFEKKWTIPVELYRVRDEIYWLHALDCIDFEDAVKFIWTFSEINGYKMHLSKFNNMIKDIEYGLLDKMERFNPDILSEEEKKLRKKVIELLINLTCKVNLTADYVYIMPASDIPQRIEEYRKRDKYKDMFERKTVETIWFHKFLEQKNKGIDPKNINIDMDEVEQEYNINLNKIRERDKRIRYRDIEMIDADTKEVVHKFSDRAECMEKTGIDKTNLSKCITSTKVQRNSADKYAGWRKWKNKLDNKYYYFKESFKE